MNRESKTSDNRKPQLNLALEKSISGCWAMNLQRQKVSESETKGRWEGEVQSACEVSEWEIRSFMDHDSWLNFLGRNRAGYICFLTFLWSEIILKTFCIPGWSEEKPLFSAAKRMFILILLRMKSCTLRLRWHLHTTCLIGQTQFDLCVTKETLRPITSTALPMVVLFNLYKIKQDPQRQL